jgi:transposase
VAGLVTTRLTCRSRFRAADLHPRPQALATGLIFLAMRKNRYVRRAKISEEKFRRFLRCFTLDMEATKIARLCRLNRNTVNRLGKAVRERMAEVCEREQACALCGQEEQLLEGPVRVLRSRLGRRLVSRVVSGRVLPDGTVQVHVEEKASLDVRDSVSARWTAGEGDTSLPPAPPSGEVSDTRPEQSVSLNPRGEGDGRIARSSRLRTLDNFWSQAMLRLAKFKGVSRRTYHLHLKECQFRFNHRREDLYSLLLRLVRERPLF